LDTRTPPERPIPAKVSRPRVEWLRVYLPMSLLVVAAFAVTWHFVQPAPPTRVVIATGGKQGIYYATAQKYVDYFGANGVTLEVRETGGSVDNFKLLEQPDSGVDVAIVQGGSAPPPEQRSHILAVAGIYYEPVLVFYRGEPTVTRLSQLAGRTIAIGAPGSGVRGMAQMLLGESGVTAKGSGTTLVDLGGDLAADALAAGRVDAAFYVIAPDAPVVARLLRTAGVRLVSFDQARAEGRLHPFLSATTLYRGIVDVQHDLPPSDVQLLAAPATLVVRDTAHQAVVQLLVRAAQEVNSGATMLSDAGAFPAAEGSDLPFSRDARFFLKNPPSILHRTLPFWLASMVDRLIILVLPLLVVLIPLARMAPPLLRWRTQRKLLARYQRVRQIEENLAPTSPPAVLRAAVDELHAMDREIAALRVPVSFARELYNLRVNVGYVCTRLNDWIRSTADPTR
jgi:TRAP transporter TAXI family solute receptor